MQLEVSDSEEALNITGDNLSGDKYAERPAVNAYGSPVYELSMRYGSCKDKRREILRRPLVFGAIDSVKMKIIPARSLAKIRLREVSNFGDGDCGAGEIHTRARAKFRARARLCISPAPQSPSPKLETTRSLREDGSTGFYKFVSLRVRKFSSERRPDL